MEVCPHVWEESRKLSQVLACKAQSRRPDTLAPQQDHRPLTAGIPGDPGLKDIKDEEEDRRGPLLRQQQVQTASYGLQEVRWDPKGADGLQASLAAAEPQQYGRDRAWGSSYTVLSPHKTIATPQSPPMEMP